jgi:hypothetical protein
VSEGQTWNSEDTRLLVSKSFLVPARSSICLPSLRSALTAAAFSEAECIVFAAEGLFLAHDFPFNCGIRVEDLIFSNGNPLAQGKNLDLYARSHCLGRSGRAHCAMASASRCSHYVSGAGFGSPCLRCCEKEASLSAACARSFTRESFSKSANGFAVSMRPSW